MPVDISNLSIKANLKTPKGSKSGEKPDSKMVVDVQVKTEKKVTEMIQNLVPLVRNDIFDRLNR